LKKKDTPIRILQQLSLLCIILLLTFCNRGETRHEIISPASITLEDIVTNREIPKSHKAFQARFLPEIYTANNNILRERNLILDMRDSLEKKETVSSSFISRMNVLLRKYRLPLAPIDPLPPPDTLNYRIERLLNRADIVPVRLVMAQAIIESGWGSSDFARVGNNYFGIRCYEEGCGLAPAGVDSVTFYVKVYHNEMAGIEDYLRTLNTHFAYKELRKVRAKMRKEGDYIDPLRLLNGLNMYSEEREEYVTMVSNIIRNYIPGNTVQLLQGVK
jgi:Bax protein